MWLCACVCVSMLLHMEVIYRCLIGISTDYSLVILVVAVAFNACFITHNGFECWMTVASFSMTVNLLERDERIKLLCLVSSITFAEFDYEPFFYASFKRDQVEFPFVFWIYCSWILAEMKNIATTLGVERNTISRFLSRMSETKHVFRFRG